MTILGRMLDLEEAWRECSTCELHRGEGYMNSYHGRMGMAWTNDMGKLSPIWGDRWLSLAVSTYTSKVSKMAV